MLYIYNRLRVDYYGGLYIYIYIYRERDEKLNASIEYRKLVQMKTRANMSGAWRDQLGIVQEIEVLPY